jgi:acrosin
MSLSWFNRLLKSRSRPASRRRPARARLGLESLEARLVPTVNAGLQNGQLLVTTSDNSVNTVVVDHAGNNTVVNGQTVVDSLITAGIEIELGTGANTVNLLGTFKPLTVVGHGGQDRVTIGRQGDVQDLQAPLTIEGLKSSIALTVDSHAEVGPQNVTLAQVTSGLAASSIITGLTPTPAVITFFQNALSTLTLDGGSGGNTFTVGNTFISLFVAPTTTINSGAGNDTVNVQATTGPLVVNGVGGADTLNVGNNGSVQGIKGAVTVGSSGGVMTLNVDDHADPTQNIQATLGSSNAGTGTITNLAPAIIQYGKGVNAVNVSGGSGGSTFTIADTLAGVSTTLRTVGNNDSVAIAATHGPLTIDAVAGSNTVGLGQARSTQGIHGTVSVSHEQGSTDLVVDDAFDSVARQVTLADGPASSTSGPTGVITGLTPAVITYQEFALSVLGLNGGGGGNTFTVQDTFVNAQVPGALTIINSGEGSDTVNVQGTGGLLEIDGVDGFDKVNIGRNNSLQAIGGPVEVNSQHGFTALTLNDQADPGKRIVTMDVKDNAGTVAGLAPALISYFTPRISTLTVNGGGHGNTFLVNNTMANGFPAATVLNTGPGNDTVNVRGTTGALTVNTGAGNDTVTVGSTANTLDAIHGSVTVNGQAGLDRLLVNDQGSTTPHLYHITPTQVQRSGSATITYSGIENLQVNQGPTKGHSPQITIASFTHTIRAGQLASVNGQLVDPDKGVQLALAIDFGDGSSPAHLVPNRKPFTVQHRYPKPGTYTVRAIATDSTGQSSSRDLVLTVLKGK